MLPLVICSHAGFNDDAIEYTSVVDSGLNADGQKNWTSHFTTAYQGIIFVLLVSSILMSRLHFIKCCLQMTSYHTC